VKRWLYEQPNGKAIFSDPAVISLAYDWYDHPDLMKYKNGYERIRLEADKFLLSLGYQHISRTGKYKAVKPNDERVALFAHQGFGIAFLSCLLDIPYPQYASHFDICHTGMTVIDFKEENGYAYPTVLMHSSDAHLYQSELPTTYNYNHRI
jgi:probable phosphoglycerate mutase